VERWIAHACIPADLIVFAAVKEQEQVAGIHRQEIDQPLWSPFRCGAGFAQLGTRRQASGSDRNTPSRTRRADVSAPFKGPAACPPQADPREPNRFVCLIFYPLYTTISIRRRGEQGSLAKLALFELPRPQAINLKKDKSSLMKKTILNPLLALAGCFAASIGTSSLQAQPTNIWNFDFSGSIVQWTVPSTGFYDITAYGAQGGNYYNKGETYSGGQGAVIGGSLLLTVGDIINILVGGQNTGSSRDLL